MNILSFDVEDWYCHDNYSQDFEWSKHEVRIHKPLYDILDCLDEFKVKGTFFCLGWLAEYHPEVILEIHNRGHHIGCHSYQHQLAYRMDKKSFFQDTLKAKKLIEDICGTEVNAYRAPSFSIIKENFHHLETLIELGFKYDSSIFPASRECGGYQEYGTAQPKIIISEVGSIKEFPINTYKILNKNIIFSGGGYFRIMPYPIIKHMMNNSEYIMSYFHPSDFDPGQPRLRHLPITRQIKNHICLKSSFQKFRHYIADNEFVNFVSADALLDWEKVEKITILR